MMSTLTAKKILLGVNKVLDLEQIREKLRDRNLKEVSRQTGVGYNNLHGVATGSRNNPTYNVIKTISDYLENNK